MKSTGQAVPPSTKSGNVLVGTKQAARICSCQRLAALLKILSSARKRGPGNHAAKHSPGRNHAYGMNGKWKMTLEMLSTEIGQTIERG